MKRPNLRTIRTGLDLTHDTMARRIAVATDTVVLWESNDLTIQEPMSHVIRLLESHRNG